MLLFRSAEEAVDWGYRQHRPFGASVALGRLQDLATRWYGDRLRPDWRPRSTPESQAILDRVGLSGDFWRLT